ncbi:MAG: hypothetical protein IJD92_00055 [Bacilli bacterium]|nr:hypothetical protein [Bacilli bacterium]
MSTIYDLKKECVKRMLSYSILEREYNRYNLTEFLKTRSMEELEEYVSLIVRDDIIGIRANIYDAILLEIEYRNNSKIIEKKKTL